MDIAQQISGSTLVIEVLVKIFFNKADTNEMGALILVLSENLIRLFFSGHRIMEQSWRDEHTSLPHQVYLDYISILLHAVDLTASSELIKDNLILVKTCEQLVNSST